MRTSRTAIGAGPAAPDPLLRERLSVFTRQVPLACIGHLVLGGLTTLVLWGTIEAPLLAGWYACVAAIAAARWRDWRRELPADGPALKRFEWKVTALAGAAGAVWGIAGLFFFPADDPTRQLFLALVIIGLAGGAIPSLSAVFSAAAAFLVAELAPLAARFAIDAAAAPGPASLASHVTALMVVVFILAGLALSRAAHMTLHARLGAHVESRRLAGELAEARGLLQATLDNVEQGIMMITPDRGVPVCNRRVQDLLGLPAELMERQPTFDEIVEHQWRAGEFEGVAPTLTDAFKVGTLMEPPPVYERRRPNGMLLEVRTTVLPDGAAVRSFTDVTALREREEALMRAEEANARARAAEETSRLKSQFIANMSHELRTPLNAILGFSDILSGELYGPLGDARYRDYVDDIRTSGRHLLAVVSDILDLAKIEAGYMELSSQLLEPAEITSECLRVIAPRADISRVELSFERRAPEEALMRGDPLRLRQVLLNLLSNGVKFTPEGGKVSLSLDTERAEDDAEWLVLSVTDTGVGMSPAALEIALQPFRQVDGSLARRHDGTGLGLPLAKRLVELMNGRFEISSAEGKGTKARVLLPSTRLELETAVAA
jgi:signal transduction histidine kinase